MEGLENNLYYKNKEVCFINKVNRKPLQLEGVDLTAQNIWENRDYWIEKVFNHYRYCGFPFPQMTKKEIKEEFNKLCKREVSSILTPSNEIKNSGNLCLNICRFINNNCYWNCRGRKNISILEAFDDDETLLKVLKNRMGYAQSQTDWVENGIKYKKGTYYLFDMSDDMLLQGFRSSMLGFSTSNFKVTIAKFLIDRYCQGNKVLDPSIGWSARYLAARSLNKIYFGIDPSPTTNNTEKLAQILGDGSSKFFTSGSENTSIYGNIPGDIDYVIACPPYFDLEIYSGENQSISNYKNYDEWLNFYWKKTVENIYSKMRKGSRFTLIMIETFNNKNLLKDMLDIIKGVGDFKDLEILPYKTSRSHMSKKAGNTKNTELCVTLEKAN